MKEKPSEPLDQSTARKLFSTLIWIAVTVGIVIGTQAFLMQPFQIPSGSMLNTIKPGDRVMVGKLRLLWSTPHIGQVLVFSPPQGSTPVTPQCGDNGGIGTQRICSKPLGGKSDQVEFIKRVVALGGDRVALRQGVLWRNGKPVKEPYALPCNMPDRCNFPQEVIIPQGHVLMMGDNRENSDDGRFWGPISEDWIAGPVVAQWWPLNRLGLGNPS